MSAIVVETIEGVVLVDPEAGTAHEPLEPDPSNSLLLGRERPQVDLPRVVAADGAGSTVVAVVERKPPLVVSHDAGRTWRETGGGLPTGFDVAVDPADPDRIVYAARNRLYLSTDGGVFWRSLPFELPDIVSVAWSS